MATTNLFGDLALDATLVDVRDKLPSDADARTERVIGALESCALLLASIKDQLPRVSSARVASVAFDAAQAVTVTGSLTTVTTVTTCSTVTTCATLTTARNLGELARPADALPVQIGHMGSAHIYNGITVS